MRPRSLHVAWLVLALAGCAAYRPQPVDPAASLAAFEAHRLDDAKLAHFLARSGGDVAAPWDLRNLALAGLYYNSQLEAARAKWRVTRAAIATAGKRPNPDLDAAAGRATNAPAGEPSRLADIQVGFPFETAGKRGDRITRAEGLSEAARLAIATTAWKVRGEVRDALIDAASASAESAILADEVRVQESILAMLARRVELGAASSLDEARAGGALAQARLDEAAARAKGIQARSRLAAAIGVPEQALDGVAVSFRGLEPADPREDVVALRRAALFERSDLRAALATHAAADAALRLEIAKQYPDVEIAPAYSYDTGTNKFTIGLVRLSLPLLDRNAGPIAEAKAQRDETAAQFEALQASVLAQLEQALHALASARAEREHAAAIESRQRAQWERVERRFRSGEDDRLALESARLALETARLSAAKARHDAQRAIAQLEDATQQPYFDAASPAFRNASMQAAKP